MNYFNEIEIKLLQELADNIAFALDKIELKALQQKAKAELAESEQKFRILVEQSLVGVYVLQDEKFIYVNPGFEKISGYSNAELTGQMSFDDLIHEDDIQAIRKNYETRINGDQQTDHYTLRAIRNDGECRHIEIIVSAIIYKNKPAVIGSVIDITERIEEDKRVEQAIIDAQEKERMQIGMELHDNVKQIMGASILQLSILKRHLDDEKRALELITTIQGYNSDAVFELRRLSHQLAPSLDEEQSLAEKITALASNMNAGGKLQISVDVDEVTQLLNNKSQLTFYRIIQEQLNNIIKYAKAASVMISIKRAAKNIILTIRDDGQGFDTSLKKEGIGLENIRRRAGLLDGKTRIESAPGQGCSIIVDIPVMMEDEL